MRRQGNTKKAYKAQGLAAILAVFAMTGLSACKGGSLFNGKLFKERAAEKPAPSDEGIEKSFFVNADGKPKTFLCALAPEVGRGDLGEQFNLQFVNETAHCNIEFEITENYLVGKLIQPSFLNDRSRWTEMIKIPIRSHYYYEHQKDAHGRETNEWIENSSRSHWSARPMMKLDLAGMRLSKFSTVNDGIPTSVEDIEWDRQNNFLGFSINAQDQYWYQGRWQTSQVRYRVNFLKFEHDPSFQKVPYNEENSRYMNILHVMGRKIEGIEPELYAAHWDLRKPTTIYLNGVPPELEKIVRSAIEKWNVALREIGALAPNGVAFNVEVRNSNHPFDLRYPAINWISDRRISATAPLGVGMAHADVRNGKIIWGGISLWGGALESYINHYTPIESVGGGMSSGMTPFQSFVPYINPVMKPMDRLEQVNIGARTSLIDNMSTDLSNQLPAQIALMQKSPKDFSPEQIRATQELLMNTARNNPALNKIVADLIYESRKEATEVKSTFAKTNILKMLGQRLAKDSNMNSADEAAKANPKLAAALKEKDLSRRSLILKGMNNINNSAAFVETELTAQNMSASWMASPAQRSRTYPEMLESVVMDLVLHEFGHMIGLGHQFKENIVPEKDTVPSKYVKELAEKATEEKGFTNYTSVMGYRSGRTEMIIPASDLAPGPHDKLVLRYLYRGQYSVYDINADDFIYLKMPVNGKIPARTNLRTRSGKSVSLPVSYFPQCNDFEASLDADPFCNRWDKGSTAEDITKSYFEYVSDNLLASLYNVTGGGSSYWYHEYRMWRLALGNFSRVRLFYDEMRRRLRSEPDLVGLWDELRQDNDALFEFSQACRQNDPTDPRQVSSDILQRLFKHKDIVDLCRANAFALDEFGYFLSLPEGDYTKIDHKNRFVSGGYLEGDAEHSFGNYLGTWYQLSNFPLKFSALFALTSADPFQFDPYWGITPNYFFDSPENRFLYRTLYPRKYTQLISSSVQNNMRFTATGMSDINSIGRTILATSSLLPYSRYSSNDSAKLPSDYNEMLDQQSEFQMSMVAVIIAAQKPDPSSGVKADHYKKFTAQVYDFFTGKNVNATEVFILPQGNVIVWANGMFLFPMTRMKFYDGTSSYIIAYKVAFDYQEGDRLVEDSVKYALNDKHTEIERMCIDGFNGNGLSSYFDSAKSAVSDANDFEGFYIPPGIAVEIGKEKTKLFYDSIEESFKRYARRTADGTPRAIPATFPIRSMRRVCEQANQGIGQIAAAAALLNGYWLNITANYVEK